MNKSFNLQDARAKMGTAVDNRVRVITAGLGLNELRALLRGDPPTEKPNPRYKVHTTSFLFHIRPRYYELGSTIFTHTFRLGFLTTFFFFIELITGIILMLYYTPSPDKAFSSIVNLMTNVPFGGFFSRCTPAGCRRHGDFHCAAHVANLPDWLLQKRALFHLAYWTGAARDYFVFVL